jgi:hypothetical protein
MGLDVSSSVVVGIRASDILRRERYQESITKYNENTGKPYQVHVNKEKYFIFDKEMPADFELHPDNLAQYLGYDDPHTIGEGTYRYPRQEGYDAYNYDKVVIGEQLINGDSHRSQGDLIKEIDTDSVAKLTKKVKENFAKHGYKGEVKVYLVTNVSC